MSGSTHFWDFGSPTTEIVPSIQTRRQGRARPGRARPFDVFAPAHLMSLPL